MTNEILHAHEAGITRITLNRPRVLNALSWDMVRQISLVIEEARREGSTAIWLDGAGERGFCGGGDVKEISTRSIEHARAFLRDEYIADHAVHVSQVPVIGIMDGITMGGGIGLTGHAAHRIVTEHSHLAMPETRIAFVPDVGGHLLLARAPGRLGELLAVTSGSMNASDAIALGFADALVPSTRLDELRETLMRGVDPAAAIEEFAQAPEASAVLADREWFDPLADAALGEEPHEVIERPAAAAQRLLEALEAASHERAQEAATAMRAVCPTTVAVTLAQLARTRAFGLDLAAVLDDDLRVLGRLVGRPDFAEGIRARLIDKDNEPRWSPATIADIDASEVASILAPWRADETPLALAASES